MFDSLRFAAILNMLNFYISSSWQKIQLLGVSKSNKKGVRTVKRVGDVLTIVIVAGILLFLLSSE